METTPKVRVPLIGATQLAEYFSVTKPTIYNWVKAGCPHSQDARGRLKFNVEEVREWRIQLLIGA